LIESPSCLIHPTERGPSRLQLGIPVIEQNRPEERQLGGLSDGRKSLLPGVTMMMVLLLFDALCCWIPARRGMRLEPLVALKQH
jgi:hypothetical protein